MGSPPPAWHASQTGLQACEFGQTLPLASLGLDGGAWAPMPVGDRWNPAPPPPPAPGAYHHPNTFGGVAGGVPVILRLRRVAEPLGLHCSCKGRRGVVAAAAGVHPGDQLLAVCGIPVASEYDVRALREEAFHAGAAEVVVELRRAAGRGGRRGPRFRRSPSPGSNKDHRLARDPGGMLTLVPGRRPMAVPDAVEATIARRADGALARDLAALGSPGRSGRRDAPGISGLRLMSGPAGGSGFPGALPPAGAASGWRAKGHAGQEEVPGGAAPAGDAPPPPPDGPMPPG
eukprot:gene21829-48392_t